MRMAPPALASLISDANFTITTALSTLTTLGYENFPQPPNYSATSNLGPNSTTTPTPFDALFLDLRKEQLKQIRLVESTIRTVSRELQSLASDVAWADTPLSSLQLTPADFKEPKSPARTATNTTLTPRVTKNMRTGELVKNWKVVPLYATAALLARWFEKSIVLPLFPIKLISTALGLGVRPGKALKWSGASGSAAALRTAEQIQDKWRISATTGSFRRSIEIWGYALGFVVKEKRLAAKFSRGRITKEEYSIRRTVLAGECVQILLKLGPTFIKVGQLLSTRIDIVPAEYIAELKLLQDNVPPFAGSTSIRIIERELGRPITELFDTFNTTSLAAASLGQVHVASKAGVTYCVKVQREYLRELFAVDLRNLRQFATFLDAVDPKGEGTLLDANTERDWLSIYEESKRLLYEEISYENERLNCERFKDNFSGPKFDHVRVPNTYADLSTDKVLTMEFVPGIKITDVAAIEAAGMDPVEIGRLIAEAYLEQLTRHGYFHCDPHPGNVAVEPDENGKPRLIFYDFGMMDQFGPEVRQGLVNFMFAFYENQPKEAVAALAQLGILRDDPNIDRIAVERVGKDFMDRFQETLEKKEGKFDNQLDKEEQVKVNKRRRAKLGEEFLTMNSDVPFQFPPTWTFVFRAFMSLDGIGKTLDPNFDMTRIAKPYLKELIDLKDGNAYKTIALKLLQKVGWRPIDLNMAFTQPRRVAYVEDVSKRLEQGEFKLRVRALETERMLERSGLVEKNVFNTVMSAYLINLCVGCAVAGGGVVAGGVASVGGSVGGVAASRAWRVGSTVFAAGAFFFGAQVPLGLKAVRNLDKYYERFGKRRK